mmetsp:Transcript_13553/g.31593  ORF Transcript_13553/g.31593 Transcript_13553/m.31593 type:complete len:206 (+) Transcript_13553:77-694(+)
MSSAAARASNCSSEVVTGGVKPIECCPAGSTMNPSSRRWRMAPMASTLISTARMSPRPLCARGPNALTSASPRSRTRSQCSFPRICSMTASAAAHATGCPRNVWVWIASPLEAAQAAITAGVPMHAESGNPPPRDLPMQRRSGTTPSRSLAKSSPEAPRPQAISSNASTAPASRVTSARSWSHPAGGSTIPPRPRNGSTSTSPTS